MSSTELFDAASISITSRELAAAIERHDSQTPHGLVVGPCSQFSEAARILAIEVLPVPREPTNRYAWWTLSCSIALDSVRTTCSCPTTSAKERGRWRRYSEAEVGGTTVESSARPGPLRGAGSRTLRSSVRGLSYPRAWGSVAGCPAP